MKRIGFPLFLFAVLQLSCQPPASKTTPTVDSQSLVDRDLFYHYSIWYAFVNKVFDGTLSAGELKTKGDLALGSYNQLDGELVMKDGILYQITEDGVVHQPADTQKVVYANATFFEPDHAFTLNGPLNYDSLCARINEKLPSDNLFYAFNIHGTFSQMTLGGLHKQTPPYEDGLDVLIPNRPVFTGEDVSGTMVGFFCPDFIGEINVAGYHLHFISDDEQLGGHVMSFEANRLEVQLDEMNAYQFVLPDTRDYRQVGFEKAFQYENR